VSAEALAATAAALPRARAHVVDVTDAGACAGAVESLGDVPDVLVASAGVSSIGSVADGDPAAWERALAVNALGLMYAVRAALPGMLKRGAGTIVAIASASGRVTYVGEPAYVASKHAAVAFCDALRKEVVGSGVRVCVVEPGLVDTPMARAHPLLEDVLASVTPLRPEDVARLVGYVLRQPPEVAINEVVIRPTSQAL